MIKILRYGGPAYLLLVMLIRMLSMQISIVDYACNKNFIAQHLCENRLNTRLHCEGKCYLKKQLKNAADTPATSGEKEVSKAPVVEFCEKISLFQTNIPAVSPAATRSLIPQKAFRLFITDIFHPPLG